MQAARKKQQKAQLQQIKEHHQHVLCFCQALVFREDENRHQIRDDRGANGEVTQTQFETQAIKLLRNGDGCELSCDCEPTQQNHGSQPDPVRTRICRNRSEVQIRQRLTAC